VFGERCTIDLGEASSSIPHAAIKKVSHDSLVDELHPAWKIYEACMSAPDPVALAVEFFRVDRVQASIPRGTPERLGYELCIIDALRLKRYVNIQDVVHAPPKDLVSINHPWIGLADDLPHERCVASPWVRDYMENLAVLLYQDLVQESGGSEVEHSFVVSSLVRPVDVQKRLWNSPARCLNESSLCSSHTTGSTFDITKKYLPRDQEALLVRRLQEDRKKGKILFILEPRGNHYHVFVFPPELAVMIGPLQA